MMLQVDLQSVADSAADFVDSAAEMVESTFSSISYEETPVPSTPGQHLDYILEKSSEFLTTLINSSNLVPALTMAFFLTTAAFFSIVPFSSLKRHVSWLLDTLWAGPCIICPEFWDSLYTKKFIKEFEEDALANADPNKKTIGIILVMGAQNAGENGCEAKLHYIETYPLK